ncbi:ATP-binding protein, partial [Pseudomonas syringae group genomosp. 7]|uniref:ATP-binding protein n=1 Tax=Pseudomonas syringae group genomosp. 7 TaxID=251699 RepID=UPI0037705FC8
VLEPVSLSGVLEEALVLVSPMAADAIIELKALPPLPDALGVMADLQRLIQVLLNLLSNAIKYNRPNGEVQIEIEHSEQQVT